MDRRQQFTQACRGASLAIGDRLSRLFDLTHQPSGNAGIDRLLGLEKAVNVRRAHSQSLGDVGYRRLLIADLAKQALRGNQYLYPHIRFDVVGHIAHLTAQPLRHLPAGASTPAPDHGMWSDVSVTSCSATPRSSSRLRYHNA